jgi:thiol peroxidase
VVIGFVIALSAVGTVFAHGAEEHGFAWDGLVVPFGIATLSLAILTACAGLLMPKNRKVLFRWHKRLAAATIVAGVCHATLVLIFYDKQEPKKEPSMNERAGIVTMRGKPLTLLGNEVKVGEAAPNFVVQDNQLSPVEFSSFRGKVCVISSVPSLDTPVCDLETRRFNQEAERLGPEVVVLTISMDLPFAQKRWCGAAGVTRVQTLSDHGEASFGMAYGVLIKELRLLARAVFVVDKKGIVRYVQLVRETTKEPDYDSVLGAVRQLASE